MTPQATALRFGPSEGWRYGLLGLPLAFVALPLYVLLPHHYATVLGVPLALLGGVLLAARLLDAFVDPLIGRWVDRLFDRDARHVLRWGAVAALVLALGFALLFFPPVREVGALLAWAAATLTLTYLAFSTVTVAHQSWGARLGGDEAQRARIVGWREGLGVAGVLVASVAPTAVGLPATTALFACLLAAGWIAWRRSPLPATAPGPAPQSDPWLPLRRRAYRRLLAIFMLNGTASAVPATLVLFFIQDRLEAPRSWEPAFLGLYFLCAAASLPLWLALVRRAGLARSWLAGMALAISSFIWTLTLGAGDGAAFLFVCAASGLALGADLALPGALLAGLIQEAGDRGRHEGAYFGWWNFATKLNLALAAGLALPLLELAGYTPGTRAAGALDALSFAYGLLPCLLKLLAAAGLYLAFIRTPGPAHGVTPSTATEHRP